MIRDSFGRRVPLVLAIVVCLLASGVAPAGAPQSPRSLQSSPIWPYLFTTEEQVAFEVIDRAVQASGEGGEAMMLGIGSWMERIEKRKALAAALVEQHPGMTIEQAVTRLRNPRDYPELFPSRTSDLDGTIATIPDGVDARSRFRARVRDQELVNRINAGLDDAVREGRLSAQGREAVKIIVDRDPQFKELFRGEIGQRFARDYAESRSAQSTLQFSAGGVEQARTERFWANRGLPVPSEVSRAHTFVEDSVIFLEKSSGDVVDRFKAAAKYRKNVDGWLRSTMAERFGSATDGIIEGLTQEEQQLVRVFDDFKNQGDEALRLALRRDVGQHYEEVLEGFIGRTRETMTRIRDQVEVAEFLGRAGKLPPNVDPRAAATLRDRLARTFMTALGPEGSAGRQALSGSLKGLGTGVSLYFIMDRYYAGDMEGVSREVGMTLLAMGVPEAALPATVAVVGAELVKAGVIAAGQSLVFEPLNQPALADYYLSPPVGDAPGRGVSDWHAFTWDQSPFQGLSRETLWRRYPYMDLETALPHLEADAARYVEALGRTGVRVTWGGAGSLQGALVDALARDWERSKVYADAITSLAEALRTGFYEAPIPPLEVVIDSEKALPGETYDVDWRLAPGERRTLRIGLARRFGRIYGIPNALRTPTTMAEEREQKATLGELVTRGGPAGGLAHLMLNVWGNGVGSGGSRVVGEPALNAWLARMTGVYETRRALELALDVQCADAWTVRAPWNHAGWKEAYALRRPEGTDFVSAEMRVTVSPRDTARALACPLDLTLFVTHVPPDIGDPKPAPTPYGIRLRATVAAASLDATVVDKVSGAPIAGAHVELERAELPPVTATSDAAGRVRLADVPPGTYALVVSAAGYRGGRRAGVGIPTTPKRIALTPVTGEPPAPTPPPEAPSPPAAAVERPRPATPTEQSFSVQFGDRYVPKEDKTDAGQPIAFTVPGPGTVTVTYTYRPGIQSTVRYYGDENGYRSQARVEWSGAGSKPGRLNAGWLYRGTTFLSETTGTGSFTVSEGGEVILKAYPEETPAYYYRERWVDNWYDATHTHYHGAAATISVAFVPGR